MLYEAWFTFIEIQIALRREVVVARKKLFFSNLSFPIGDTYEFPGFGEGPVS